MSWLNWLRRPRRAGRPGPPRVYTYQVSFRTARGTGTVDVDVTAPIRRRRHVQQIEDRLSDQLREPATVLYYHLVRQHEQHEQAGP